ncbi:hypothetical protein niasHT_016883 [Heterodera trifolii]|uniref:EF-hand domain-containing protein n=1 Tax=Heterodera trifolii TaxID=157864 RepID=A0ABD2KTN0_9BILA
MSLLFALFVALFLFGFAIGEKEEEARQEATNIPILPFNLELADKNGDGEVSLTELRDFLESVPFAQRFKVPIFDANGGEISVEQMSATLPAEAAKFAEAADKAPKNDKLDFAEWKQFIYTVAEQMLDTDKDGVITKKEMEQKH